MSPELGSLLISSAVTLLGLLLVFFTNKRANRVNEKKLATEERSSVFEQADDLNRYIDDRIERAVAPLREKLAAFERRDRTRTEAFVRVLRSLFVQWPKDHPRPFLHRTDVQDIEETIPPEWLPGPDV
jgi:hypothetical protein